jgi:hypothetical protein
MFAALMILALLGCASDIELDRSDFNPRLVVISSFFPGNAIRVTVSTTKTPEDNGNYSAPPGTTVRIVAPLDAAELLKKDADGGFITENPSLLAGTTYVVEARAPGFEEVTASTTIPKSSDLNTLHIEGAEFIESEVNDFKTNVRYDLSISLKHGLNQYYHLIFYQTIDPIDPDLSTYIYPVDPEYPEQNGYLSHHESGVLIDIDRVADPSEFRFSFSDYYFSDIETFGAIFIEVRTISEEYYLYYTSLARQEISRKDPFAEPISIFNNVDNGFGNFSSYNYRIYSLFIDG